MIYRPSLALVVTGMLATISSEHIHAQCVSLDGEYVYFGDWIELKENTKESLRRSFPQPPISRFGIKATSRHVITPKFTRVTTNLQMGYIHAVVIGSGVNANLLDQSAALKINEKYDCVDHEWRWENKFSGGNEGGLAAIEEVIYLSLDGDRNLVARGEHKSSTGLILKDRIEYSWSARFKRVQK